MSQEKVAKYKESKVNRKEIMKKQKRNRLIRNTVTGIVCLAAVAWVGYSAVAYYQENKPRLNVEVDYSAVEDFTKVLAGEEVTEETTDEHEGHDHE